MSKATISKSTEMDKQDYVAHDSAVESHVSQRMPIRKEIERRAYELHLARGAGDGHDLDDWIQAERRASAGEGMKCRRNGDQCHECKTGINIRQWRSS